MKKKMTLIGGALAAMTLLPGAASASFLLDTGTPTGTGAPVILNSAQWFAASFSATAGQDITALSAYLTQGLGQPGDTFTFDIYSSTGFTGRANGRMLLKGFTGTFTANGWNTTAVDWVAPATTSYWLALQVGSSTQTKGLDLPVEASNSTGTAPAGGFAYLTTGSTGQFTTTNAPAIGLEVSVAPVPLPAAAWLFGSGLFGLGVWRKRRTGAL